MEITITTAGLAALVNAQNTGTLPVLVAEIGVTSTTFVPDEALLSLPNEIKRLSTFSGQVVFDDTIHVTIRDDSPDAYTLRGFGLYLEDGTLFAAYGQATPILEKSSAAILLLAADIRFTSINGTDIAFGDANWLNPPASETVQGVVELASNEESATGTDTQRVVTPVGMKYALDERLGSDAPSAFAKGLLAHETAEQIRTALGVATFPRTWFLVKPVDTLSPQFSFQFVNDPHLHMAVESGTYLIEGGLSLSVQSDPSGAHLSAAVRFNWQFSGNAESGRIFSQVLNGTLDNDRQVILTTNSRALDWGAHIPDVSGGQPVFVWFTGHFKPESAGTIQLQFQATDDTVAGAQLRVNKQSFIKVTRIQ